MVRTNVRRPPVKGCVWFNLQRLRSFSCLKTSDLFRIKQVARPHTSEVQAMLFSSRNSTDEENPYYLLAATQSKSKQ